MFSIGHPPTFSYWSKTQSWMVSTNRFVDRDRVCFFILLIETIPTLETCWFDSNEPRSVSGDKIFNIFFQYPVSVVESYFISVNFKYLVNFVGICSHGSQEEPYIAAPYFLSPLYYLTGADLFFSQRFFSSSRYISLAD